MLARLTFIGFKDRSAVGRRLSSTEIAVGEKAVVVAAQAFGRFLDLPVELRGL